MKPNPKFANQDKAFWACVRSLSQDLGYTIRGQNRIKVPSIAEMRRGFTDLGLNADALADKQNKATELGGKLHEYFLYRARILETVAQENLMNAREAKAEFTTYRRKLKQLPSCPLPWNKQKGDKYAYAYLTGLVNMIVEVHAGGASCNFEPRKLTTITHDGIPLRTLSRWVDGAFPDTINPVAVWEVKEYYYTTTFGSRIADGVYESLLDGMELEELRESNRVDVKHYLFLDAKDTWWGKGKGYLCRIVDMLNMGYVDEVLFGREIFSELPRIVSEWLVLAKRRGHREAAAKPALRAPRPGA